MTNEKDVSVNKKSGSKWYAIGYSSGDENKHYFILSGKTQSDLKKVLTDLPGFTPVAIIKGREFAFSSKKNYSIGTRNILCNHKSLYSSAMLDVADRLGKSPSSGENHE